MLIDRSTVVTAAHCFPNPLEEYDPESDMTYIFSKITPSMVRVYTGFRNISSLERSIHNFTQILYSDPTGLTAQYEIKSFYVVH
jgi:hypothetical protein